jgi:hypothetical protein
VSAKALGWILLIVLAVAAVYGFLHERLWAESLWSLDGRNRFLAYTGAFWSLAGVTLWRSPRWLGWIIPLAALIYTAWWAGPVAPLASLYFLGSCFFLGRVLTRKTDVYTATLLGSAVWMFLIWIALHFPINTRTIYAAAFLVPYILNYRSLMALRYRAATVMEWSEAAALAVLLFVLIAHLLAALKPEISADGLSMHLAFPMAVARDAGWAFDFRLNSWALMPNGADVLYAAVYLLGGEQAAHLLNFAFLVLLCTLVARGARRWVSPPMAWLAAALFASTPLVQLVTGSLFVENVWAALILAATLALVRYLQENHDADLILAAVFVGAALAVKVLAGAFALPIVIIAAAAAFRKRQWKPALIALALLALFAAPTYVFAYAKTGNPIFPFANATFQSPDFDTEQSFADPRFIAKLSWKTAYTTTFRSNDFLEAQGGAVGFQYFLLLGPAILWARRKDQWAILAIGALASGIILSVTHYLRYLYPALPLASIAIAWLVAEMPSTGVPTLLLLSAVNLWFLPSSGFYNQDFALFRHSEIRPYLERMAPVRLLIDDLNQRAPGEPVAFFSTERAGGLKGPAYTDSWHSEAYWSRIKDVSDARQIAVLLNQIGVRYVVAPTSKFATVRPVQLFLRLWLDPVRAPVGPLGLFQLRNVNTLRDATPVGPGRYDDLDGHVEYTGPWRQDLQFPESSAASLTYSETPGAAFRITFTGRALTYVFTQAANRGIAEATIDGESRIQINQYSAMTRWQATHRFADLEPGTHTLDVRVSVEKDPQSAGLFVDLDAFVVEP